MTNTGPAKSVRAARPRPRWPLFVLGALLIGSVGGGIYLARTGAETVVAAPVVSTQAVQRGVVRVSVSGPGMLEAAATRTVGADQSGTVGTVPPVGERVNKGQLLTRLSSDAVEQNVQTAELNLQKARASLDATRAAQAGSAAQRSSGVTSAQGSVTGALQTLSEAQITLDGQRQLHAIGALSTADLKSAQANVTRAQLTLDSARAALNASQTQNSTGAGSDAENLRGAMIAVQQAQAALETAQQSRASLKLYAPITGVVSTVSADAGTVVSSGATILTILDDTSLNLPVQIDETEIAGVQAGQNASVTLDAYDGQTFNGKVVRVSPGATQSSGISVFTATVTLPNPNGQLRSGMTAEAEIIQSEERGLLVPNKAIQTVRNRSYVEVPGATPDAGPERVRITAGASDGTNTVVTEGLEAGQDVIVPGSTRSGSSQNSSGGSTNRSGFGGGVPGGFGGGR
ncbi:efflux RND transporter periplasmic adaptor subunit [Deinococcus sp. AJ005]|uniref:efflux RND transporter periplasmic adaptor subunit n=1 Tax=Deinococcus sp. AJ005 TaxID=2652443 RepID=UPI00125CD1B0|nr:efflux RND transporter periplasmic adaptor subunit [Deinococcus sp. AJ005]QFP75198.1 efflux RND transporter periplasmic adaptor subunit [Deinococcus sp. AJ005]